MNRELATKVADAVLYEGYMLYPYRGSALKNRQRWVLGILYPPSYAEVGRGTERSGMHSECLVQINRDPTIHIQLRFLHLVSKQRRTPVTDRSGSMATVMVDAQPMGNWDEGIERSVELELQSLEVGGQVEFGFAGACLAEPATDGSINSTQYDIAGSVSVRSEQVQGGVLKLSINTANDSSMPSDVADRNAALLRSFLAAHLLLTVTGGEFVSLLDPPETLREAAGKCNNVGNFPVLVGNPDQHDMLLCSPIILYDYPQIAPESAGDFYDATEMEEMLTLRVMTLTDREKEEIGIADQRLAQLLQRTQQDAREQLRRTHGIVRDLRQVSER